MTPLEKQQKRVLKFARSWQKRAANQAVAFQHELSLFSAVINDSDSRILKLAKIWRRDAGQAEQIANKRPNLSEYVLDYESKFYKAVIRLEEMEMLERVSATGEPKVYPMVYCLLCERRHKSNSKHKT